MQELVLDLHLHSRFSRAVSPRMNLQNMYLWGRKKGINIFTVADWTHPMWFREAKSQLEEVQEGVYALKNEKEMQKQLRPLQDFPSLDTYFILSTEISCIYSEQGVVHRIHNLVFSPSFETAEKVNKEFTRRGLNLSSDGRPTFGLSAKQLVELLFSIDMGITIIPCHIWTPWFSLYGSKSGYDSIIDCFGKYHQYILAVETGLSSDPSMNWRISELEKYSIVSFSDAHSLEKMGREATVLKVKSQNSSASASEVGRAIVKNEDITYKNLLNAFRRGKERVFEIAYTIEFYPEEGKYHYTGHRNCNVSYDPLTTPKGAICSVCSRPLTVGVMHRVDELATTPDDRFVIEEDAYGVKWMKDKEGNRPPFVSLVPLLEILAEGFATSSTTQKVLAEYENLLSHFGSEHEVLFRVKLDDIAKISQSKIAEGIARVRARNITIKPGFDGEYGVVSIWNSEDKESSSSPPSGTLEKKEDQQLGLF